MALVTCAGADVLAGELHLPLRGAWMADLTLDAQTAPTGAVKIAASGGLSLSGTVLTSGVAIDTAYARIVGGAGGLGKTVTGALKGAQVRDALSSIMSASGEVLSQTVAASLLSVTLPFYHLTGRRAARALDEICTLAAVALGAAVNWRFLSDGTIWIGTESWPSYTLPAGADLLRSHPGERRHVLGVETPALLPGVALSVGNVVAVDHYIEPDRIRSHAWT